ncbi:MAG: hypothetical protein KJ000_13565 [Pirellulaceae bacterium]|nr:hypothetical protein [Pirellulaceae bacterium]
MLLERIVSGGQTGVDRGALDAALALDVPHGGWCPLGRVAEDGAIPAEYELRETPSPEYPMRTEQNVIDSDGTLILYRDRLVGGTELTRRLCVKHERPVIAVDLAALSDEDLTRVRSWIKERAVHVLNVAGPRESSSPGIADQAMRFLCRLLAGRADVR